MRKRERELHQVRHVHLNDIAIYRDIPEAAWRSIDSQLFRIREANHPWHECMVPIEPRQSGRGEQELPLALANQHSRDTD
ncbi:MAG TPA: hypothetical protein PK154_03975 [Methanoregulaceae archaeon]|nr:hypothetical protein [Methanoregulaceae archaeon]HOH81496.1 hypothetical protein [Methanoregulaceae archaeon]HPW10254.1 hypothetical protein [Methanoregulaceae archaeon]